MIRRAINIDDYWEVIVYYNIDYNLFHIVSRNLAQIGCSKLQIKSIYNKLRTGSAKAATVSSADCETSVVLFNKHKSISDYVNSIVHESEHIKQSMLYAYNVKDEGEEPAYTIGYIAMRLLEVFI